MKRTTWLRLTLILALFTPLAIMPGAGLANRESPGKGPDAPEGPVLGWFIDIRVDNVYNYRPDIVYNSTRDEFLVVWSSRQNPSTTDVWAARVGRDGTVRSTFCVASGASEHRDWAAVAYSPTQEEYLIVYEYQSLLGADFAIMAKHVSWNGASMSAEFSINSDSTHKQEKPAVAYNGQDDEVLVVYEDGADTRWDLSGNRVQAGTGWAVLPKVTIATDASDQYFEPDLVYNETNSHYLIAYNSYGSNSDLHGKMASADLATLGTTMVIAESVHYAPCAAAVATCPGEYLVVWGDAAAVATPSDIMARRVSLEGVMFPTFVVAEASGDDNVVPDVANGMGYGYLVTWEKEISLSASDVYGRYVMRGQDEGAGGPFEIDATQDYQGSPAVACAPLGDCLVVEVDNYSVGGPDDTEIRGRFVSPHRVYLPLVVKE